MKHYKDQDGEKSTAYVDWLLTPRDLRIPPTQEGLAQTLDVNVRTLQLWRKEPRFQRTMSERARGAIRADKLPDVIEALYKTALGFSAQSVAAAKLLLDFAEKQVPTSGLDVSTLTPDQLRELAMAALEQVANDAKE